MSVFAATCDICVRLVPNVVSVRSTGSRNETFLTKLQALVPEVEWMLHHRICASCQSELETAYEFRARCIRLDFERQVTGAPKTNRALYACYTCGQLFIDCQLLSEHIDRDHDETKETQITSTSAKILSEHLYAKHRVDIDIFNIQPVYNFICEKCPRKFATKKELEEHIPICGELKARVGFCQVCGATFETTKDVIEHCIKEHSLEKDEIKPFACDKCPKRFTKLYNLQKHELHHSAIRNFVCTLCGRTFKTKREVVVHEQGHLNQRKYKCELCCKGFNCHTSLYTHVNVVHSDYSDKKFACHLCTKRFCNKQGLEEHIRRHKGEKPFKCHICPTSFVSQGELKKHIKAHTFVKEVNPIKCKHCDKTYKLHISYKLHLRRDHGLGDAKLPEKKYTCGVCSKKFDTKTRLKAHVDRHAGIKRFQCEDCGNKYADKGGLRVHMRDKHEAESPSRLPHFLTPRMNKFGVKCSVCLSSVEKVVSLSSQESLLTKLRSVVSEVEWLECYEICASCESDLDVAFEFRNRCIRLDLDRKNSIKREQFYECYHCNNRYGDKEVLIEHIQSHCVVAPPEAPKRFKCDDCNKTYTTQKTLKVHLKKCKMREPPSRKNRFSCEVCNLVLNYAKDVVEHCVREHSMEGKLVKPYTCNECPMRFSSSANLIQHRKYHDGSRNHICSFCGKSYITKSDLTVHEYIHFNRRNYKCEFCDKAFNTNKNLRSHILVVHTESTLWKYGCDLCNRRFPLKSGFEQHMKRHTGDKRFGCHICDKSFVSRSELQKHVGSHSMVNPFKCTHCEKAYKEKRFFEIHLTKHHGIGNAKIPVKVKKFACHVCPNTFFDKHKLQRHLRVHSGVKPYGCQDCGKKFSDKYYLKQHAKNIHNNVQSDQDPSRKDSNLHDS
ncbi:zinc finger protein 600-like [Tribolium madens]|uniref:zinc finger protein 600-like n=1 Tax=Tribolium madens TaxID=41895 RepID=UPI001CF744AF|nr:zinc finger protein 600-like [Tribolium madens]